MPISYPSHKEKKIMANNKGNRDSGCFATVLRHLLCRHGAPTHPADVIGDPGSDPVGPCGRIPKEESKLGEGGDKLSVTLSSGRQAGVVARLMGLEMLPDTKWVPSAKSPDVFSRSRSVNFMDYLLEVDLSSVRARRHRHRRVKTSVSFHEIPVPGPTMLPPPKEKDVIIVILEDCDREEEDERVVRTRKGEVHGRKKSDGSSKEKKVLKLRDEPRTRGRAACNHKLGQSNVSGHKSQRKDAWKQVVAAADDADGSSPVSVLDKPERCHLQGNNLRKLASASSSRDASRHESTSTRVARILDPVTRPGQKVPAKEGEEKEFPGSGKHLDGAVQEAQRLAQEEAGRLSLLLPDTPVHEEICRMIEQHALNHLLEELVRFSPGKSPTIVRRRDRF